MGQSGHFSLLGLVRQASPLVPVGIILVELLDRIEPFDSASGGGSQEPLSLRNLAMDLSCSLSQDTGATTVVLCKEHNMLVQVKPDHIKHVQLVPK